MNQVMFSCCDGILRRQKSLRLQGGCNILKDLKGTTIMLPLILQGTQRAITEVTGLPRRGTRWFGKRKRVMQIEELFVQGEELLQHKRHGIAITSLPPPWDTVSFGIQKFLTCEGRYTILYHYHFKLLAHLRHGHLINIPYFLYGMLKQMASHVQRAKHPSSSVSHHGLIKLLVLCSLERQG